MQGHVRVAALYASEKRNHQAAECIQGVAAECAKQQVEPHHVRLELADLAQNAGNASRMIRRPAAHYVELFEFSLGSGKFIGENRQIDKRVAL